MTPNLLPLYVACFAMIGLLGGFARSNKRTGWVKKRRSLFDDLLELQTFANDLEGHIGSAPKGPVRIGSVPSLKDSVQFSSQLAGLNAGLKTGVKIGGPDLTVEQHAEEKEHVSV